MSMERLPRAPTCTLKERLVRATSITRPLVYAIVDQTCPRFPSSPELAAYARLRSLIVSGAWLDVAMALIDLRLPRWQVLKLHREDGEWHCTLSLRWAPAVWLNQHVIARHAVLELAILSAFYEAYWQAPDLEHPTANVVPLRPRRA